jgi:hypothetical protein
MLTLRSYLGLAAQAELPAEQRLEMCAQVKDMLDKPEEKKLLLAALGSINSPAALGMIVPYLDDPAARDEASAAAVAVADRLLQGRNAAKFAGQVIEPLQKVAEKAGNADLAQRAKTLATQAQSKAKK